MFTLFAGGSKDAMQVTISKSNYVAGVQCLKRLYLQIHQPELAAQAEASESRDHGAGLEVGVARINFVEMFGSICDAYETNAAKGI